jgi:hypothetical protein
MKEATRFTSFSTIRFRELQGATMGSFGIGGFMCNGANFAYTKSLFEDLNGLMEIIRLRVVMMFSFTKSYCQIS